MRSTRTVQTARGEFRAATLGSGPPLLLLHTLRNGLEYHALIAPALAERYTVHAIDLPGHGESERELARPFDPERFYDGVRACIEAEDLRGLTLVGESIGATTALVLGARIPDDLPVTLAYGDHDWAAPEHREATAAANPGVQEHITMEGTGHWSFRDNPDAVVRVVPGAA